MTERDDADQIQRSGTGHDPHPSLTPDVDVAAAWGFNLLLGEMTSPPGRKDLDGNPRKAGVDY